MLLSMTGYGKASFEYAGKKTTIEIKSLNSKAMDISTRIPFSYREKDVELRNILSQHLIHGKVDFVITVDDIAAKSAVQVNINLMGKYREQMVTASQALGIALPDNMMEVLLRMPDVMRSETTTIDDEEWRTLLAYLNEALENLDIFRRQEGAALHSMFTEKLDIIEKLLAEVEPYEGERIEKIKNRLVENLEIIKEKAAIDPNRLEQEMIFYLEKLDINEEKVRLRNHIRYFRETMENEKAPGKKLGFIAQEMGREINTLGSKSNHSEMQIIVVKMKDQLEQIKEQVLNVL
ncbi:MAG: YicC family protein [Paludibacteraceae bacterium]|nr:YicC family protein [Paludibacteraceae bacterium]